MKKLWFQIIVTLVALIPASIGIWIAKDSRVVAAVTFLCYANNIGNIRYKDIYGE